MRHFIDLIEKADATPTLAGWERWFKQPTTFDGDFDWLTGDIEDMGGLPAAYEAGMDFYKNFGEPITAYRGLPIQGDVKQWLANPTHEGGLGISWAYDRDGAFNKEFGRGHTTVVLVGSFSKSIVDWYCTFSLAIVDGEEHELRLFKGGAITLSEAWILDKDYNVIETVPLNGTFNA